jgi:hypothetical protein
MAAPTAIPMVDQSPTHAELVRTLRHLTNIVGAACGKPLMNDEEAAAWLGYDGDDPKAYMQWLRHRTSLKSVKLQKRRRWRRSDLEEFANNLPVREELKARRPRLKKSA